MTGPPILDAVPAGADGSLWRRLVREGWAAYRVEARIAERRRTRLQSAKILDASGRFRCEAAILDLSASGLRVLLARNLGLPGRVGVHVDLTCELLTATVAWRRERLVGLHVIARGAPGPLKASDRLALNGRYYAVTG